MNNSREAVTDIDIPGLEFYSGKVGRVATLPPDWYQPPAGEDPNTEYALSWRGDGISAFNHRLTPGIPDRGVFLHMQTDHFANLLDKLMPGVLHDRVTSNVAEFGDRLLQYTPLLENRAKIIRKGFPLGVEWVVRNALDGTGLKPYRETGKVCGVQLPPGLKRYQEFPSHVGPKLTPTQKTENDEATTFAGVVDILHRDYPTMAVEMADYGREKSLEFFRLGMQAFAKAGSGFRLGDGKFELFCKRAPTADKFDVEKEMFFGDEYHTGDSSRIWSPGEVPDGEQPIQYSKQFVREWLKAKGYNPDKGGTPPVLEGDVVNEVREKYRIPFEELTGLNFAELIGETH